MLDSINLSYDNTTVRSCFELLDRATAGETQLITFFFFFLEPELICPDSFVVTFLLIVSLLWALTGSTRTMLRPLDLQRQLLVRLSIFELYFWAEWGSLAGRPVVPRSSQQPYRLQARGMVPEMGVEISCRP